MAIRFIEGFDHYAIGDILGKWSATGRTGFLSMTSGRLGGQALRVAQTDAGQILYRNIGSTPFSAGVLGFALRDTGVPAVNAFMIHLFSGATSQVSLAYLSDRTLSLWTSSALSSTAGAAYGPLSSGVWHYVEVKFSIASSVASNSCQIYLDGVLYSTVNAGAATNAAGGTTINSFGFDELGGGSGSFDYDDMYLLDIDSDTPGRLGDSRVEPLYPTGAGANTNWTNSGGASNWASASNSTPDGDTTYVATGTTGTLDTYAMGNLSSTPTTIHAVQANIWARKDATSNRDVQAAFVIGGTAYYSDGGSINGSYSDTTQVVRNSPATSAAWTATEINGMESGVNLLS